MAVWTTQSLKCRIAAILAPRDAYYAMQLGVLLLRAGKSSEAVDVLTTAVALKRDPLYHCILADAYLRRLGDRRHFHYKKAGVLDDYDRVNLKFIRNLVEGVFGPGTPPLGGRPPAATPD